MEKHDRPGRNDPCWCGSGIKYKNCHLPADEAELASEQLHTGLHVRLHEYALSPRLDRDFQAALQFFYGPDYQLDSDDEDEKLFYLERGLDYFVHDFRLSDDRRLIEHFIGEQGRTLAPAERALLESWRHSWPGAFEVIQVMRGQGLRLRDLVSNQEFEVREKRASEQVNRWDILITRVLGTGPHYELGGMGLHIPPRFSGWLRSYLQDLWDDYRWRHEQESYEDFMHASSQLLNQFVLNEIEPAMNELPTMVTVEGDLVEACRATYDVLDYPLVLAALQEAEEFEEEGPSEGEADFFIWREVGESLDLLRAHGPAFEHRRTEPVSEQGARILGRIALMRESLELTTESERRLQACKELLEKRAGGSLQHVEDEIVPLEEALGNLPDELDEEQDEELTEELEELETEYLAQDKRSWMDRANPALDGKTPRQAVETLGGRMRVIQLLKEFEGMESERARAGDIPYSWDEVKKDIGLTDEEFIAESRLEDELARELQAIEELAYGDQILQALDRWRAFCTKYRIASAEDLEFAQVWDLYGLFQMVHWQLVEGLASQKLYDQGIALTEELAVFDKDEADEWRAEEAMLCIERGDVQGGVRSLQELAARNPDSFSIVSYLADAQRDLLNRPDDAITTLRRALPELSDELDQVDASTTILEIYEDDGRLDEAERFWHEENDELPEEERDAISWVELTVLRRNWAQARVALTHIQDEEARQYWTGRLEAAQGNYAAARKAWADQLQEPDSDDWFDWHAWTELQLRLHQPDRVLARIHPERFELSVYGYYFLALAYALKGDRARATAMGEQARSEMERNRRRSQYPEIRRSIRRLAEEIQVGDAFQAIGV